MYSYYYLAIQGEKSIIIKKVRAVVITIIGGNIQAVPFNFGVFLTVPDGMPVSLSSSFLFSYLDSIFRYHEC